MEANFQRSLPLVLRHEGGFVDHPDDPGGATNKGITIGTMRRYIDRSATVDDLKRITDAQIAQVYKRQYWDKVKADDLPAGIDYATFDFSVNSGPSRGAKSLQSVLGVSRDGVIGPVTIAAARSANPTTVINQLCDDRMAFLKRLKHWPTFGRGWTNRVSDVRKHALGMAGGEPSTTPKPTTPTAPEPNAPAAGKAGAIVGLIIGGLILAGAWTWETITNFFTTIFGG